MKSLNRYFGILWLLIAFIAVSLWFLSQGIFDWTRLFLLTGYMSLLYLFYNSRSLRSRKAPVLLFGVGLSMVALLFRIFHWPAAHELQTLSVIIILMGYLLFFIRNTSRKLPDILKLIWICSAGITYVSVLYKVPDPFRLEMISGILFWPMYLSVCISEALGHDQSVEEPEKVEMPDDIL